MYMEVYSKPIYCWKIHVMNSLLSNLELHCLNSVHIFMANNMVGDNSEIIFQACMYVTAPLIFTMRIELKTSSILLVM